LAAKALHLTRKIAAPALLSALKGSALVEAGARMDAVGYETTQKDWNAISYGS